MSAQEQSRELAVVEQHDPPQRLPSVQVAPQVTADELVRRLDVIQQAMTTAMRKDVDYGVIPGTGSKPTLLKPGAEKLGALFQLDVQLANEKVWHDDGHLTVICRATVYHQPTGTRLGSGEGICSTREVKYAFRNSERVCPSCKQPAIIKGKDEFGGGWVCWRRKGGCDTKFPDGDAGIEGQSVGKVPNENLADAYNTVDKMASKRARIDAVLAVTGASALFTQDVEDFAADEPAVGGSAASSPDADAGAPRGAPASRGGGSSSDLASDNQKRYLTRLLDERGLPHPDLDTLTRQQASKLIEETKAGNIPAAAAGGDSVVGEDDDIPFMPTIDGLGG